MGDTTIEWTDKTWNPIRGCSRVSEGCRNCYAERVAGRFSGPGQAYEGLAIGRKSDYHGGTGAPRLGGQFRWTGKVVTVEDHLEDPLRWTKPRRIFTNSMSDFFHENLPDAERDRILAVMLLAPRHTFMTLTKRAEKMQAYLSDPGLYERVLAAAEEFRRDRPKLNQVGISNPTTMPASWIWWGVTAEDQQRADERIPLLLKTPAVVRFVSYEPALERVDFSRYLTPELMPHDRTGHATKAIFGAEYGNRVSWLICGCESGPGARRFDDDWARDVRDQCAAAGVPFFLKQGRVDGKKVSTPELDGRQHVEFPR